MSLYATAADAVMILHALLILAVFVGIGVALEVRRFRLIEAAILVGALLIWSLYGGCPLTQFEEHLRLLAGTPIPLTQEGFISHYLSQWFHVSLSDRTITLLTYGVAGFFLLLSFEWFHAPVQRLWHRMTLKERRARRRNAILKSRTGSPRSRSGKRSRNP